MSESEHEISPKPREIFLILAFAALVAGGIVTVLIPALNQDTEHDAEARAAQQQRAAPTKAPAHAPNPPQSH